MKSAAAQTATVQISTDWPALLEIAIQEVFEIMLGGRLSTFHGAATDFDLTAIVGLAGQLCGVLTLCCSQEAASLITARMLGDAGKAQINEHLWDAVGEMCNMVAGNFKNKLPNLADNCLLSVPTVIVGKDYKLRPRTGGKTIEVLLQFDGYPVAVTLNVHT